jgi:iron complex outermembrane receptor protein
MKLSKFGFGFGALVLFASAAPMALAAADPPPTPAGPPSAASDQGAIIVTATREKTNIQKTAVQVTALTAQKLKDAAANQLRDITYLVPSVRFGGEGAPEATAITMRGVGASAGGSSGPGVQVYFEEVPLVGGALNLATYDMADVQVLQGPQGTLFGRNTLAGAILNEPVLPSFDQNGYLKATYGTYNYAVIEGAGNITLVPDVLAIRLSGQYQRRDGFDKALSPTGGPSPVLGPQDNLNNSGFRASVLFQPTPHIKNMLTFDYTDADDSGQPDILADPIGRLASTVALAGSQAAAAAILGYPSYAAALADAHALASCHHQCFDYGDLTQKDLFFKNQAFRVFNTTTWDVTPNITLKNIFGWQQAVSAFSINSGADIGHTFVAQDWSPIRTLTEEFQVQAHAFDDRVHGILGVYYQHDESFGKDGFGVPFEPLPPPFPTGFAGLASSAGTKASSEAAYANISVNLTRKLTFNGGFRYTWDQQTQCTGIPTVGPGATPGTSEQCFAENALLDGLLVGSKSTSAPTWSVGFNYQATPNLFFYVVSRRGYRAPALNSTFSDPCELGAPSTFNGGTCDNDMGVAASINRNHPSLSTTPVPSGFSINLAPLGNVQSETLTDIEFGMRSDWSLGGWHERLNLTYFHYWYDNVGVLMLLGSTGPGNYDFLMEHSGGTAFGGITTTAGKITADGVQGDFSVMPTHDLTFDANFSYLGQAPSPIALPSAFYTHLTQTEINNINAPDNNTLGQLTSVTPPWSFSVSLRYVLPVHPLDGELVVNYEYFWTAGWFEQNVPLPGYDLHNLRLDWNNIGHTNISAGIWVRNLLNSNYIISGANPGAGVENYGPPREVGVDLTYKFH